MMKRKALMMIAAATLLGFGTANIAMAQCQKGESRQGGGKYAEQSERGQGKGSKGGMRMLSMIDDLTPEQQEAISKIHEQSRAERRAQVMAVLTDSQREQLRARMQERKNRQQN